MSTQKLLTFLLTAFLLSLALVSAATNFTATTPATLTTSSNTTTFTITALVNTTLSMPSSLSFGNTTISISPASPTVLTTTPTTITLTTSSFPTILGTYSGSLLISNASLASENQTVPITFTKSYCTAGDLHNGTARYIDITSVRDDTPDGTSFNWKPGDQVTLTVKAKYNNDAISDDSVDAVIKLQLYDTQKNVFVDFDNQDDLERSVTIDEGSTMSEEFTLKVPVSDIEGASDRYKLYVKVYEDKNGDKSLCTDTVDNWDNTYFRDIIIKKNSYDVALKNIAIDSASVPCGQTVTISATEMNIGNNDDKAYVEVFNKELGLNLTSTPLTLNQGDSSKLSFSFIVPSNATEKTYTLYLTSHYRYSKSTNDYKDESDAYSLDLKVDGCIPPVSASVTADFNADTSKAVIGNLVTIDAKITNTGTATATYNVDVSGNSAWSKLADVSPKTFTLNAGETKTVSISLDINSNAEAGDQTFTIKTTSGTYATEKTVKLTLEKGLTSASIVNNLKQYWYLYLIALIILILIIVIIIAIVSISRKS